MLKPRVAVLVALVLTLSGTATAAGDRSGASRRDYLNFAASTVRNVESAWWNPEAGWYAQFMYSRQRDPTNVATLWDTYGLFEAIDLVAIAQPTAAHRADVERFARGAEQYWDPYAGGYWYKPNPRPNVDLFFDDNGWFGLAYFDAYAATGDRRFLNDALRAYRFIKNKGWNPNGGGIWWDTQHMWTTIEPLAAEALLAAELYRATHARTYLKEARFLIGWANRHSWNRRRGLYQRSPTSDTVMNYAQGMMIGAHVMLYKALHAKADLRRAEKLATASLRAFPHSYHWAVETDAIYLRGLLQLSAVDGSTRWYAEANYWGQRAFANTRDGDGLPTRDWDGGATWYRLLRPGGTLMLLASLGAFPTLK
jgi:uncharacterized protein YyaL (SSP411 family)